MKKIFLRILFILIAIFLVSGLMNKTFFKNYYEVTNLKEKKVKIPLPLFSYYLNSTDTYRVTFKTLRKTAKIQNEINKYVENLTSCYDESYFYDSNLDITIKKYQAENSFPFNKISLIYEKGNFCENEYVLDVNWKEEFLEKAEITEANMENCLKKDTDINCNTKKIDKEKIENFLRKIKEKRIENTKNISLNEEVSNYLISVYYFLDKESYLMQIFNYNNNLAFKIIDSNDHAKNALYQIDEEVDQLLNGLSEN